MVYEMARERGVAVAFPTFTKAGSTDLPNTDNRFRNCNYNCGAEMFDGQGSLRS